MKGEKKDLSEKEITTWVLKAFGEELWDRKYIEKVDYHMVIQTYCKLAINFKIDKQTNLEENRSISDT